MCDPTKMCVVGGDRTTDAPPQISFSGAAAEASEAQPISMSRNEEELNITGIFFVLA